jgi:hypothetical protein
MRTVLTPLSRVTLDPPACIPDLATAVVPTHARDRLDVPAIRVWFVRAVTLSGRPHLVG